MKKRYRLWLTIMSAVVILAVLGLTKVTVKAANVTYIDADGNEQTVDATPVDPSTVGTTGLTVGWWVLNQDINAGRIDVNGDVHLILGNGCTLTSAAGIILGDADANLTIYAQTLDTTVAGAIVATAQTPGAAIGSFINGKCGNITINGGKITAVSDFNTSNLGGAAIGCGAGGTSGLITINGGEVHANDSTACKSEGPGIGSGKANAVSGFCAGVVINGGKVYAKSKNGAAIGSAQNGFCDLVEINGGEINAESVNGAAIGSGFETNTDTIVTTITINGGTINAASNLGAAIGSGYSTKCGTITINGGQITAMTGNKGIGAGYSTTMVSNATITIGYTDPDADFIKASSYESIATIKEGCFFITEEEGEEEDKEVTSLSEDAAGKKIVPYPIKVEYCTVSLDSTLGVNMYLRLPGDINNYKGDYMSFTINDGSRFSRKVEVVEFNEDNSEVYNGRIYYSFTCPVYVPEMADQIDATFYHGNQPILTAKYSVKQYIDDYIEDRGGLDQVITTSGGRLVAALGDYGHFTQQMLKTTKKWTDGDHTEMPVVWNDSPKDTERFNKLPLYNYAMDRYVSTPLEKATMSIVTDEDVALKFYLTAEQGSIPLVKVKKGNTVLAEGTDYTLEEPTSGSTWVVRIGGINALQLGDKYNVEVNGLDCYEDASVMGYVYSMKESTKYATNNEVQNAIAALAIYYDCAKTYH